MVKDLNIKTIENWYININRIYESLQDDESKWLFFSRIGYALKPSFEEWLSNVSYKYEDWRMETAIQKRKDDIVLYGAGHDGVEIYNILLKCGITPLCFCTTDGECDSMLGLPVYNVDEVIHRYKSPFFWFQQ